MWAETVEPSCPAIVVSSARMNLCSVFGWLQSFNRIAPVKSRISFCCSRERKAPSGLFHHGVPCSSCGEPILPRVLLQSVPQRVRSAGSCLWQQGHSSSQVSHSKVWAALTTHPLLELKNFPGPAQARNEGVTPSGSWLSYHVSAATLQNLRSSVFSQSFQRGASWTWR